MKTIKYLLALAFVGGLWGCNDDDSTEPLQADMTCDVTQIMAGEKVCFSDRSTGNPARWDWVFEGGTPDSSQCASPEIVYNQPGTYSVTLKVGRGPQNSEKVYSQLIEVAYPTEINADFEADKTNAYNTEEVSFTDKSTGFPNKWQWTFTPESGTPVTSTEQNPKLKFEPGLYTVTLAVSSPVAQATVTKEAYLNVIDRDAVAAEFSTTSSTLIMAGQTVTFKDETMGRPTNFNWQFEGADQATSTDQNPTIKYSTPGRFKVTLTASNEVKSSTVTKEAYISVLPTNGLLMYLPLSGSLEDVSGFGRKVSEKKLGKYSLSFNGESRHAGRTSCVFEGPNKNSQTDYAFIQIDDADYLPAGTSAGTFVMWVWTNNTAQSNLAFFNRGWAVGGNPDGSSATSQSWCRFQSNNIRYYRFKTNDGNLVTEHTGTAEFRDGQWHCVVLVKDPKSGGVECRMYVDGKLKVTATDAKNLQTAASPWYIGSMYQVKSGNFESQGHFQGRMNDIMLYDRAFTDAEVLELYNISK